MGQKRALIMPRVLPAWMTEKRPPKNIVYLPHAQYFRETVDMAIAAIEILTLPREVRCFMYGERVEEPFHFFRNSAVFSVGDAEDTLEVMIAVRGPTYADGFGHWDDPKVIAVELAICIHLFEMQFAPLFGYLDGPYLILP